MSIKPHPYVVANELSASLAAYLGSTLDSDRANQVLNMAVWECLSVCNPLPEAAASVILDVAARAYANPTNATAQAAGGMSATFGAVAGGLWLTRQNIATLRRLNGGGGVFTIDVMPADAGKNLPWWDNNGGYFVDESPGWA